MFKNDTFTRTGSDTISNTAFNCIIGAVLLWGFAVNWYMVSTIPFEAIKSINPWIFLIGYLASAFLGIWMFTRSEDPLVSFIGYNFVVIPIGFVMVLFIPGHSSEVIESAIQTTALVTLLMMFLGSAFPKFFLSIGPAIFFALVVALIVEVVQILVFNVKVGIMDWIIAAIFCGSIGFNWARANSIPKTADNAVDAAASLFIDIMNLFTRIVGIKTGD